MERLTKRDKETTHENGICCANFLSSECHSVEGCCSDGCKWEEDAWNRLACYEDTGLSPAEVRSMHGEWQAMMSVLNSIGGYDRLRELAEADKDGRVVVLPCKVGQRVFALLDTDKHLSECEVKQIGLGNEIGFVGIEPIGARGREYGVSIKGFGKTVFLTREEAEAALEAMV